MPASALQWRQTRDVELTRPRRLREGDTVAAVTLSFGGPAAFPARYAAGKRQLEATFGVSVVEMPHTLADSWILASRPEARAEDLMAAFADQSISGIVSTIGGDDSIRILPHLDLAVIADNPKAFIGYSDTTVGHMACIRAGLGSLLRAVDHVRLRRKRRGPRLPQRGSAASPFQRRASEGLAREHRWLDQRVP